MRIMRRRGFSLAAIMLLTAVFAVMLAAMSTVRLPWDRETAKWIAGCAVGGVVPGTIVGAVVVYLQANWISTRLLGIFVGAMAGAAAGALLAVPQGAPALAVGGLLLVVFGAVVRRCSARPDDE